jgi:hypothetical protein
MASSRFFPSRLQSLVKHGKLIAFQIAPNGTGTPTLGAREGVASVARTAAGAFTVTLQDQYRALVDGQCSLQFGTPPANVSGAYTWTDATDTDSLTFTASAAGNALILGGATLKVAVLTGVGEAVAVTSAAGVVTVNITLNTGTSTPASVQTLVNTTSPTGLLTITAKSGTAAFSVFLAAQTLAGASAVAGLQAQFGAIDVVTNKTVKVVVLNPNTGTGTDITAATGNYINCELFVQSQ